MFVERVEASGWGGLASWDATLSRVARLGGSARACSAATDAMIAAFAAFDSALLRTLLERWGCRDVVVEGDALPEGATWSGGAGLGAILDPGGNAVARVSLELAVDPPLYGLLRKHAARDPQLVDALGEGARLRLGVGLRFSAGLDAVAIDRLAFAVGGTGFTLHGSDRPGWMGEVLAALTGRLRLGPAPEAEWLARARSWSGRDHAAVEKAVASAAAAPEPLPGLRVLPDGLAVLDGDQLVPVHRLGPAAGRAAGWAGAAWLGGADILLAEWPPLGEGWDAWFAALAEAEGSPLEQVILVGVPGGDSL